MTGAYSFDITHTYDGRCLVTAWPPPSSAHAVYDSKDNDTCVGSSASEVGTKKARFLRLFAQPL